MGDNELAKKMARVVERLVAAEDLPPSEWVKKNKALVEKKVLQQVLDLSSPVEFLDEAEREEVAGDLLPKGWTLYYDGSDAYVVRNVKGRGWPKYDDVVAMAAKKSGVPEDAIRDYFTEDMADELWWDDTAEELKRLGERVGEQVFRPGRSSGYVGFEVPWDLLDADEGKVAASVRKAIKDNAEDYLRAEFGRDVDEVQDGDDIIEALANGVSDDIEDEAGSLVGLSKRWKSLLDSFARGLEKSIADFEKPDRWADTVVANEWWEERGYTYEVTDENGKRVDGGKCDGHEPETARELADEATGNKSGAEVQLDRGEPGGWSYAVRYNDGEAVDVMIR